jgi:uncharacterized membrane protein
VNIVYGAHAMERYRSRLERDLPRWQAQGWVSEEGAGAIREELEAAGRGAGFPTTLSILGAVLIGFSAMSFVAAHWQEMPKFARLALLFAGLWGAYGLAGALFARRVDGFAQAAVLTGVGLFGASIMLIAQMYHIDGNPPDAVLAWALGALLAGVLLRSNPALATAMLLVGLWSGWETALTGGVHWAFLAGWGAVATAFLWTRWRPGLHLSAATLSGWIISLGYIVFAGQGHVLVAVLGLAIAGSAIVGERLAPRTAGAMPPLTGYGIGIAFAGLWALQFVEEPGPRGLAALALLTIALLVAAIFWGWRTQHRDVLWLGYVGFSLEILSIYFKTIGSLIGTSLFFLVAGLIVSGLAWVAYRLHSGPAQPHEVVP